MRALSRPARWPGHRAFTFGELLIAAVILATLALVAATSWRALVRRSRRSEIAPAVQAIAMAQEIRSQSDEAFVQAPLRPRPIDALDRRAVAWVSSPEWDELGWRPDGTIYGSYVTGVGAPSELPGTLACPARCAHAVGLSDVDDDGWIASVASCPCRPELQTLQVSAAEPEGERF